MIVTEKHWKEFDTLNIPKDLVEVCESGIWFKNVGCTMLIDNRAKFNLTVLNTKIQQEQ